MSGFRDIKRLLSDQTDKISGSIISDDGVVFRISTRLGTISTPRSDRYRVGDRVYMQKGVIIGKTNQTETKIYEV